MKHQRRAKAAEKAALRWGYADGKAAVKRMVNGLKVSHGDLLIAGDAYARGYRRALREFSERNVNTLTAC